MDLSNILVATDFSPACGAALRRAAEILAPGGTIQLLHVIAASPALYPDRREFERMWEELERHARTRLSASAEEAKRAGAAQVRVDVAVGRPADEVIAAAERTAAEIIVCGAHARTVAGRFLIGSVSEEIARRSSIPVLVVRELAPTAKVRRVLLAVDFDEPSRAAARAGIDLARKIGASIEAIHVIDLPPAPSYVDGSPFASTFSDLTPELVAETRARIASELERATGEAIALRFLAGSAAREIVRNARPSDVVVCGTHGRSGAGRLAFGSVATKVLRRAPCPVLVVRPAERPSSLAAHDSASRASPADAAAGR